MTENKILFNSGSMEDISAEFGKLADIEHTILCLTPENADSGLARLVLTMAELVMKLIEKQAMQRVNGGSLSEEEIERLGETLMKLEQKMEELRVHFNL